MRGRKKDWGESFEFFWTPYNHLKNGFSCKDWDVRLEMQGLNYMTYNVFKFRYL